MGACSFCSSESAHRQKFNLISPISQDEKLKEQDRDKGGASTARSFYDRKVM